MSFEGGFGSEIINGFGTGNFEDFRLGAGSKDEIIGGVFLIINSNSILIEEIGIAADTGDAGGFERFFVVAITV